MLLQSDGPDLTTIGIFRFGKWQSFSIVSAKKLNLSVMYHKRDELVFYITFGIASAPCIRKLVASINKQVGGLGAE